MLDEFEYKVMGLAGDLLKEHADYIANDTCNDWDFPEDWKREDKLEFLRAYHEWNGDPEEFDENNLYIPNFGVASFLSAIIKKTIEDKGF